MTLPWIPRITYGSVVFDLALPQRPWVPVSRGVGGYEESAAGIPSTWEYRRDAMRRMTIRFVEAEWGEVLAWLIHAQRGGQFGIAPDYRGDSYTCYLVAPRMGEDIEPRPGDFPGVWELDLTIRTVSGAVIPGRYYGITPLIDWSPGQMLSTMHFSRSSPAMYRDRSGAWRETGPNVPRTTWGTDPVTGLLVPRTLLEPAATNLVLGSSDFVVGAGSRWGPGNGLTVTPAASAIAGQTATAYLHVNDGSAGRRNRSQRVGYFSGRPETVYIIVEGLTATRTSVGLYDSSTSSFAGLVTLNWITGAASVTGDGTAAAIRLSDQGPNGGPLYLLAVTTAGMAGNPRHFFIYPTGIDPNTHAAILHHAQLVESTHWSSPIVTGGAPATRDRDTLYIELPDEVARPGTPLAIYSRTLVGASGLVIPGGTSLWGITNHGGAAPRLSLNLHSATGTAHLFHGNGEAFSNGTTSLIPTAGDLVETLVRIWTEIIDGRRMLVGRLIARVLPAGSSQWGPIHAADLPPLEPAPEWSARRLYIGSRGTAPGVYEYEVFRVWEMAQGVWRGSPRELLARARTDRMGVR